MSAASAKGYWAEHEIEKIEQARGYQVWRPRAGQLRDTGDLSGLPLVQQIKNRDRMELGLWMGELESQVVNAGLATGVVIHPRRRKNIMDWYVSTTVRLWLPVLDLCAEHLDGEVVR